VRERENELKQVEGKKYIKELAELSGGFSPRWCSYIQLLITTEQYLSMIIEITNQCGREKL